MNSKEIVKKTIHFGKPERLPYLVYIDMERFEEERTKEEIAAVKRMVEQAQKDFILLDIKASSNWKPKERPPILYSMGVYAHDEREDEWQVFWKELRVTKHPLDKDWSPISEYRFPDPFGPGRFDEAKEKMNNNKDKYNLGAVWFTLFERLWMLRGFDNMLIDPYTNYSEFARLRDAVLDYNLGIIEQWLELGVDGIFVSDDWGGQKKLLVDPNYWRKFYKSSYKEMFDLIHQGGADVWMHSCGNVTELIPDLIELELDVLNPVQPRAMDIDYLGRTYGGKICFHGGLDVQETIPHGTPADIENETRHFIRTLGTRDGGYIPGTSHTILPDTPVENIKALFKALDHYSLNPGF